MKTFDLLGVRIAVVDTNAAYQFILEWIKSLKKVYVCVAPVSTVVDCQRLTGYRDIVNAASMVTPDGMPVVWCGRWQGQHVERTYGPDLMLRTIDKGREHQLRHFIYGSTPSVCDQFVKRIENLYPGVIIAGIDTPAYTPKALTLDIRKAEEINHTHPDIIWVALGSPKQDIWMHLNRPVLNAPVMVGIGAAIDFLSGAKPQAPRWMRGIGLEWLFRLSCEPKRLWRRYLIGNSLFVFYLLKGLCLHQSIAKPNQHKS